MEIVIAEIPTSVLGRLVKEGALSTKEIKVKRVVVNDDMFAEDETHKELLRAVVKAKEKLNEYEFKKRYNIK